MDLLRFITCGSVDDGKSTLIGRLLFDSRAVSSDILETIERQSRNMPDGSIDLSLLTDGLRSEREQGITIDIAYKCARARAIHAQHGHRCVECRFSDYLD
jgi:sulfate adenylyltransferase subunit 1